MTEPTLRERAEQIAGVAPLSDIYATRRLADAIEAFGRAVSDAATAEIKRLQDALKEARDDAARWREQYLLTERALRRLKAEIEYGDEDS